MTPEDEEFARIEAEINRRQGDTPPAAQPDYAWPTIEQRAVIQQMVDALDHADELLGGNDTLVMNGAAAGRWLLEQPAPVQEPVAQCTNSDTWNCKYCRKTETCEALEDPRNFATPPAAQPAPWVGLSEDEINKLRHLVDWTAEWSYGRFAYELERLLREKNT
jgi:hypothetical protein